MDSLNGLTSRASLLTLVLPLCPAVSGRRSPCASTFFSGLFHLHRSLIVDSLLLDALVSRCLPSRGTNKATSFEYVALYHKTY